MKPWAVLFIVCALLGCGGQDVGPQGSCTELFGDIAFADLEGRPARLPCRGNRVLVVNLWATWCGPCRMEVPHLARLAREYGPRGVAVVGIAMDTAGARRLKPAAEAMGITYPVLTGGAVQVLERTGIQGIPATLIIGADGMIARTLVGYHTRQELAAAIAAQL